VRKKVEALSPWGCALLACALLAAALRLIDLGHVLQFLHDAEQNLASAVVVSVFASAKQNVEFDFVFAFEEPAGLADLEVDVVLADLGPQPNLLQLLTVNFFLRPGLLLLPAIVLHLPVVHDLAHGRAGFRSHFDEIESRFGGDLFGLFGRHLSQHLTVDTDQTDC
jgi:hypothetical protein